MGHSLLWLRFVAALALASCAGVPGDPPAPPWEAGAFGEHVLAGRVFAPAEGRFVAPAEAVQRLASADFVLLGEKHDNPDHHRLQAWLLARLIASGRRPALVMEMIDVDRSEVVSAYLRAHPDDVDGLGEALRWSAGGWPSWDMYRPIIEAAVSAGLPLAPGNLPRAVARGLARGEAGAKTGIRNLGLEKDPPPEVAAAMAEEIRESHCRLLPDSAIAPMVLAQRARDAQLAAVMTTPRPGLDGAVLIAGAGHVRSDRGVPARLRETAPGRSILALAFLEVDPEKDAPAAYAASFAAASPPFDLLWFTPRLEENGDPCGKLADDLKKRPAK